MHKQMVVDRKKLRDIIADAINSIDEFHCYYFDEEKLLDY